MSKKQKDEEKKAAQPQVPPPEPPSADAPDREAELAGREEQLNERMEELRALEAKLKEREAAVARAEKSVQTDGPAKKPSGTIAKEGQLNFICTKKCYHHVSPSTPGTMKIYEPGDSYTAIPGEEVPRHFMLAVSEEDKSRAAAAIKAEKDKDIPPFIASKKTVTHKG